VFCVQIAAPLQAVTLNAFQNKSQVGSRFFLLFCLSRDPLPSPASLTALIHSLGFAMGCFGRS
jgi:hypothetical protein